MKLQNNTKLAVAISLACGMGSAQAAINNGALIGQPLASGTSGELFLNVYDAAATTTFVIDLGTTVDDFVANAGTARSWNLGTTFTNFANIASTDPLSFNVAGNNTYPGLTSGDPNFGVIISLRTGQTYNAPKTLGSIAGIWGNKISARAININTGVDQQTPSPTYQTDFATNNSITTADPNNMANWNKQWGSTMGVANYVASATVRNGDIVDQTLNLTWYHSPNGPIDSQSQTIYQVFDGYLSLDVADAALTWHVATVPLPGAAWLFLGGLLPAFQLQRRKHQTHTA